MVAFRTRTRTRARREARGGSPWKPSAVLPGLLAAVSLSGLVHGEESKARPFAWKPTYAEGRAAAESRGRPLLLYFPPVDLAKEPRAMPFAPRALGVPPLAEGTRVGAGEVLELLKRFEVKAVPALLLLDRRESVIQRWEGEGKIPANVWVLIEALVRRLEKREEEDRKALREARQLAASGDAEGAYRKVAALIESERTAPEALAAARELEEALVIGLRRRMLGILAREGVEGDEKLVRELEALAASTAHGRARLDLEGEAARLKARKIGGR